MSILATDKKLISFGTDYSAGSGISIIDHTISVTGEFGKTYSAGDNISIYQQDADYYISGKDWSNEIDDASANSYTQSTSYFNNWINGQYTGDITNITNNLTALSGDLSSYYKNTETSSKEQISDALQYVSANAGKVYEGVSPIVVNNIEDKISADTWTLSAGEGVSFVDDNVNKITRIDVTAQGGDEEVNAIVKSNSSTWDSVTGKQDSLIFGHGTASGSVSSINGSAIIDDYTYHMLNVTRVSTANLHKTLNSNSGTWNTVTNKLDTTDFSSVSGDFLTTSFSIPESATWNDTSNVVQTNSAQWAEGGNYIPYTAVDPVFPAFETNSGLEISIHTSAGSLNNTYINERFISLSYIHGLDSNYRSELTTGSLNFKTSTDSAYVDREKIHTWDSASNYIQNNSAILNNVSTTVQTNSAQWGQGGGGTLTGDAQGAVDLVYSTSGNIITGTKSNYDFTAGNVKKLTLGNLTFNGSSNYIKYDRAGFPSDTWYLGLQGYHLGPEFADGQWEQYKRVLLDRTGLSSMSGSKSDKKLIWRALLDTDVEGANNTITAIAGSALVGGGVTGEFVPQSAFDELKQSYDALSASYDALSSLFATYSGQWLLPNEGV